ncbi:MAG: MBL fold metallo-hydrolase [Holosporales bacterium]
MQRPPIDVTFWGVRGSAPRSGASFNHFGGATSCVSLACDRQLVILDAGSGLYDLSMSEVYSDFMRIDVCLSHGHLDHVMGLPYLWALWQENPHLEVHCAKTTFPEGGRPFLENQLIKPPLFPLDYKQQSQGVDYHDFAPGDSWQRGVFGFKTCALHHPGGATGYKVTVDHKSIAYLTDHAPFEDRLQTEALIDFVANADLLIVDATFSPERYEARRQWGHSSWVQALHLGVAARAKRIALYHHDPDHTDDNLRRIEAEAQHQDRRCFLARQGQKLLL